MLPGWEPCSFGYHGDDGNIYYESNDPMEPENGKRYKSDDIIGVSYDAQQTALAFYKNGKLVRNCRLRPDHVSQHLYATVGISSPGAVVRAVHMTPQANPAAPPPGTVMLVFSHDNWKTIFKLTIIIKHARTMNLHLMKLRKYAQQYGVCM